MDRGDDWDVIDCFGRLQSPFGESFRFFCSGAQWPPLASERSGEACAELWRKNQKIGRQKGIEQTERVRREWRLIKPRRGNIQQPRASARAALGLGNIGGLP